MLVVGPECFQEVELGQQVLFSTCLGMAWKSDQKWLLVCQHFWFEWNSLLIAATGHSVGHQPDTNQTFQRYSGTIKTLASQCIGGEWGGTEKFGNFWVSVVLHTMSCSEIMSSLFRLCSPLRFKKPEKSRQVPSLPICCLKKSHSTLLLGQTQPSTNHLLCLMAWCPSLIPLNAVQMFNCQRGVVWLLILPMLILVLHCYAFRLWNSKRQSHRPESGAFALP